MPTRSRLKLRGPNGEIIRRYTINVTLHPDNVKYLEAYTVGPSAMMDAMIEAARQGRAFLPPVIGGKDAGKQPR